jgi:hypothetical protein
MTGMNRRSYRNTRGRRAYLVRTVLAVAIAMLLAACGSHNNAGSKSDPGTRATNSPSGTDNASGTTSTTAKNPAANSEAKTSAGGHLVPPPSTPTTTPRETPGQPVTETGDIGNTVLIEPNGFWPQTLFSNVKVPVVWYNLTSHPQSFTFADGPVKSPEIPPGWSWSWKSPGWGGSYAYASAAGAKAVVVLQAPTPLSVPGTTSTTS